MRSVQRSAPLRAVALRCTRVSHRVIYHHAQRDLNTNHLSVDIPCVRARGRMYAIYTRPRTNNREKQLSRSQWTRWQNPRLLLPFSPAASIPLPPTSLSLSFIAIPCLPSRRPYPGAYRFLHVSAHISSCGSIATQKENQRPDRMGRIVI